MDTGAFQGVKRVGLGLNHPSPFSSEVNERVDTFLYSPSLSSWKEIE